MGDVINLRMARKARDRASTQARASANRARFGRTAGEKALEQAEHARLAAIVDGARRETDD